MGNIVLLDDLTINQIAAGEVIERPASVVKEMLENSIDAGAKNVTIEIKNGGITLIRITDDGSGIAADDMEIAFERHATSKIRKAEDLATVKSMGFRGEALASIAAIAKVEMISKRMDSEIGNKIIIEGGEVLEKTEVGSPVGTKITVENLFYNTPVRYKFLKKDYTETGYIEDAVTRIALVNKDVAITLISNGKTLLHTPGNGDAKSVIYSIYGKDIANGIIDIDYTYEDMRVTGVVGKPEIARNNRSNQLFFVNNRYIKDKNLTAAADQAYKGIVPIGKFGFLILNLEIDPKKVDVNVHPAKLEVRFQEENLVFKAIYHAIKSGLGSTELVANLEQPAVVESKPAVVPEIEKKDDYEKVNTENVNNIEIKEETSKMELAESNEKYSKNTGFGGLFKKILKDKKEEIEEQTENPLKEIYEKRKEERHNYNKEKVVATSSEAIEEKEDINADKKENTKELDFNINSDLKNAVTQIIESTKNIENTDKEETQIIDTVKQEQPKIENNEITQKLDPVATTNMQKTQILDSIKIENNQKTQIIDTNNIKNENKDEVFKEHTAEIDVVDKEEKVENKENVQTPSFESITAKLLEQKLKENMQDTQIIDTSKVREAMNETELPKDFEEMYKKTFGVEPFAIRKEKELEEKELDASKDFKYANQENESVFETDEFKNKVNYKFIGIVFSTYIIIEIANEMYIIDQHAAHERIMYEKVKANYYSNEEKDSQVLLLPDIITLTHKEMFIAKQNEEMFEKAGFAFEEFGENTIKLTAVPSMCEKLNTKQLFLEVLDEIDTVAVTARQEKEDKFIATVACKSAVKANKKLDEREVDSLLQRLLSIENPFTCPHGRPTAIKMTRYDLEKRFSRR